jgi:HD-GYP domain-containing protein (c-di-GMP phosphodiesterase class II)
MRRHSQLRILNQIGVELMIERDRSRLLGHILTAAKLLTQSDGAVLFLADPDASSPHLVVDRCEFDSLPDVKTSDIRVPIDDKTIAGRAALTKRPIVVRDAYKLPSDSELVLDRTFDDEHRYRRRSMLFTPMVDHRDQLVGVLLLINRKSRPGVRLTSDNVVDRRVLKYTQRDVEIARSLAGQAAVAIENARLYARLERTIESFVEVAMTAIDERDPATAGHSVRVADLSVALAKAVDAAREGPYRDVHFTAKELRELRFASLLHDIGKIGVPEEVLLKAKKVPPVLWERIAARFDLIRAMLELDRCRGSGNGSANGAGRALEELDQVWEMVRRANEPSVVHEESNADLAGLAERRFRSPDGRELPYLSPEELNYLQLRKGTLDDRERAIVEHHAETSFRLLSRILWTDDLQHVADYTYDHHEKLDGSGYPRRLRREHLSVQTQIIGLCDMYDALTQSDRPYKPALSRAEALRILGEEVKANRLDGELLRILSDRRSTVGAVPADRNE